MHRSESIPIDNSAAIMSRRSFRKDAGSCGIVRACKPTLEKMRVSSDLAWFCSLTQLLNAPK